MNSVAVAHTAVQRTEPCVVEVRGSSHGPLLARRHAALFKGFPRRDRVVMPEASKGLREWELSIRTGNSGLFCRWAEQALSNFTANSALKRYRRARGMADGFVPGHQIQGQARSRLRLIRLFPGGSFESLRFDWWACCVEHKTQARLEIAHSRCQLFPDVQVSRISRPTFLINRDTRPRLHAHSVHATVASDSCRARFCPLHIRGRSNVPKRRLSGETSPVLELAIHPELSSPP